MTFLLMWKQIFCLRIMLRKLYFKKWSQFTKLILITKSVSGCKSTITVYIIAGKEKFWCVRMLQEWELTYRIWTFLLIWVNRGFYRSIRLLIYSLLGIPKNCWKGKQQSGRIGRSGTRALNITVIFPQKGNTSSLCMVCSL